MQEMSKEKIPTAAALVFPVALNSKSENSSSFSNFLASLLNSRLKLNISRSKYPALILALLFSVMSLCLSASALFLELCSPVSAIDGLTWLKPVKFSLSIALYSASLLYMSRFLKENSSLTKLAGVVTLLGSVAELSAQFALALAPPTDLLSGLPANSFSYKGAAELTAKLAIYPVATADIIFLAALLIGRKKLPALTSSALLWGTFLCALGFIPGVLISLSGSPGAQSQENWLRLAHFAGLHALQAMPVLAWLMSKQERLFSGERPADAKSRVVSQLRQMNIAGCAYLFFILCLCLTHYLK